MSATELVGGHFGLEKKRTLGDDRLVWLESRYNLHKTVCAPTDLDFTLFVAVLSRHHKNDETVTHALQACLGHNQRCDLTVLPVWVGDPHPGEHTGTKLAVRIWHIDTSSPSIGTMKTQLAIRSWPSGVLIS